MDMEEIPIEEMVRKAKERGEPLQYRMDDDTLIVVLPYPKRKSV